MDFCRVVASLFLQVLHFVDLSHQCRICVAHFEFGRFIAFFKKCDKPTKMQNMQNEANIHKMQIDTITQHKMQNKMHNSTKPPKHERHTRNQYAKNTR